MTCKLCLFCYVVYVLLHDSGFLEIWFLGGEKNILNLLNLGDGKQVSQK